MICHVYEPDFDGVSLVHSTCSIWCRTRRKGAVEYHLFARLDNHANARDLYSAIVSCCRSRSLLQELSMPP